MLRKGLILVLMTFLSLMSVAGVAHGQDGTVYTQVMFDFGDGVVYWEEVTLAENRTGIRATVLAAVALSLRVEVVWSELGAFVADIGDRDPVFPEYFHLLVWNESSQDWGLSPLGASALLLDEGDIVGWFLSADDPAWDFVSPWPGPKPLATPDHPFPTLAFRGNLANSGATDSDVPPPPELRWRFDAGGGEIGASPVGALGRIYQVTLFNGTYALDLRTGMRLWTADVSGLSSPTLYREAGFVTVPLVGDRPRPADLVVASKDGALYRLDGGSGTVVWRTPVQQAGFTGIASSPKISGGRVLVGLFNESGGMGGLVSVDVQDGSIEWHRARGSVHMSSPSIQRGIVYVGLMGFFNASSLSWDPPYGLLSVYETNGTERWLFPATGPVASSPVVAGDALYFTTRDGYLYGVSTGGSLQFRTRIGPSTSSPAFGMDMVFAASGVLGTGGNVTAFDLQGNELWRFTPNGPVQSSLTLARDHLLFATNTERGTVYALDAASGTLLWTYIPEPRQYILPTPAVIDGLVVIASDNGLVYALGPPGPAPFDVVPLAVTLAVAAGIVVAVAIFLYDGRLRAA
ncbi:MAG: PQQ-binding-like beta-propeller repeat protein [Thermoplasmata archaeon]